MKNNSHMEENILVFQKNLLSDIGDFQGLTFETDKYLNVILKQNKYEFMKRKDAEKNPDYKELIPYVILRHEDNIFSYTRSESSGEKGLHEKLSIGIGGHITILDSTFEEGCNREINEEVDIKSEYERKKRVAIINDDTDDTGKNHLGVIYIYILDNPAVSAKEDDIGDPKFLSIPQLEQNLNKYENWSQICIKGFDKLLSV